VEVAGDPVRLRFVELDPPEDGEVERVLGRVVTQVERLLAARGLSGRPGEPSVDEPGDLLSGTLAGALAMPARTKKERVPLALPEPPPPGRAS
jgi:hypothetical protein